MGRPRNRILYDDWDELLAAKTHREGACLIWDAGLHSQGYPMVRWQLKMVQVVREQMERKIGRPLNGRAERVKNRCGNILCVNPNHYIVAEYGSQEWKCVAHEYDEEQQAKMVEIYDNYSHPKTGGKYGARKLIQEAFPGISPTTVIKILRKHGRKEE